MDLAEKWYSLQCFISLDKLVLLIILRILKQGFCNLQLFDILIEQCNVSFKIACKELEILHLPPFYCLVAIARAHTHLRSPMARAQLQKHVHATTTVRTNSFCSCISRARANGRIRLHPRVNLSFPCLPFILRIYIVCVRAMNTALASEIIWLVLTCSEK